jgi:hypothetical protein
MARRIVLGVLAPVCLTGALAAVSVSARSEPAKPAVSRILGHKVQRDSHGRILAWHRPKQNSGYDHVLRLAWGFLEHRSRETVAGARACRSTS